MSDPPGSTPLSPANEAWLRLLPRYQDEAARWFPILRRKIDPTFEAHDAKISNKKLAEDAGEDEASVCRKLQQWENGLYGKDGSLIAPPYSIAALAPRPPGPRSGKSTLSSEKVQEVLDEAANQVRRAGKRSSLSPRRVWKVFVAREELTGEKAPSFAQVRRVLRRISLQELLSWQGGVEALKKEGGIARLVIPPPEFPNQEWVLDQWVCDVFVRFKDGALGRMVAVTVIDRHAGGFILNVVIHRRFTGFTVTEAVSGAIARHGKPGTIRLDLGRENRTKELRSGCGSLGINLVHTTPRDPAVKGLIERIHYEYSKFCSTLPWHAPSDIVTKPVREEEPLTEEEFCERFRLFTLGTFNTALYCGQQGDGRTSRLELRNAAAFTPIRVDEDELRALFAKAKSVRVRSQGVKLHGVSYTHPKLGAMIGQKVLARQGREDTSVVVHDEQNHFICEAKNALAEAAQMDDEARRQFTADRRTLAKAQATIADQRIQRARSRPDYMLLRAKQRLAEQGDRPPRRGVRQITPMTGQTPAVGQAVPGRRLKLSRYQG